MAEAFSIDLLGPLGIRSGGVDLNAGPVRRQALLAVLALRANQVTSSRDGSHISGTVDALLWIKVPGDSDGNCGLGEDIPAGTFSPALANHLITGS